MAANLINHPTVEAIVPKGLETTPVLEEHLRFEFGKISKQSIVFFAGTVFTIGSQYVFKVYLARTLGASLLGLAALGASLVALTQIFAQLGLPRTAGRFVAAYAGTARFDLLRGFLWRSLGIVILVSSIIGGLVAAGRGLISEHFYNEPALSQYLPLFALLVPLGAVSTLFVQYLGGYQDVSKRTVVNSFIGTTATMLITVVLFNAGWRLNGYIAAQVLSAALTLILMAGLIWRLTPAPSRNLGRGLPDLDQEVIGFTAAMFGISVLEFLLLQADRIVLGAYVSAAQVGVYAVATTGSALIPMLLQSVNSIFGPVIADLHARGDRALMGRLFQILTKWVLGLTFPLVAVILLFARPLMGIFGKEFELGWPVLAVGVLGQLVNCATGSVGFLLMMTGNQKKLIKVQAVTGIAMLGLNVALIPIWGVMAAAVVGAAVTVVTNLLYLAGVKRVLGMSPYNRGYLRLAGPISASLAAAWIVHRFASAGTYQQLAGIVIALVLSYSVFIIAALSLSLDQDDRMLTAAFAVRMRALWRAGGER